MFEFSEIEELANQVNLSNLYEIAKHSAQIGNEILNHSLQKEVLMWLTKINYYKTEREGFEPSIKFPLYSISSAAPSTTRPPLPR